MKDQRKKSMEVIRRVWSDALFCEMDAASQCILMDALKELCIVFVNKYAKQEFTFFQNGRGDYSDRKAWGVSFHSVTKGGIYVSVAHSYSHESRNCKPVHDKFLLCTFIDFEWTPAFK